MNRNKLNRYVIVTVFVFCLLVLIMDCSNASTESASRAAVASKADFQMLKGKWLRPDGGYVLEIRAVDKSGKLDVVYNNPRPINVSIAEASRDGEILRVFIELRDVNYPGSNYHLVYDPASNQLKGDYYQAVAQEHYEIFFERMK